MVSICKTEENMHLLMDMACYAISTIYYEEAKVDCLSRTCLFYFGSSLVSQALTLLKLLCLLH